MKVYKAVVVGMGKRGKHHALAFKANPRFELAGICTRDRAKLEQAASELGVSRTSTDPLALAREVRPDIFCFCTPPQVRLELIQVGIACGARLIAYEKPMALSMNEAIAIREAVRAANVKTVVSHQHRYGQHYRKVKEIVDSGSLGRVHTVYGHAVGWMMHLFTHLVDYMRWYNGNAEAEWVMGQAAGSGKLADIHPSPDYVAGLIQFANGVRGYVETGAGAPDVPEVDYWWRKCRIGAQGTEGFAEVLTGAGWRAVTRDGLSSGEGCMNYDLDMPPYVNDMADWLDDDRRLHPCNGESAYQGFEITMGILRSVVERGQIRLPLGPGEPELEAVRRVLPARPVLLSHEGNRKEYP
ncbi:MAG TPA: Gfo/Idh/MocA family oxidoreductase [Chthonomonadaceae bacterium]|nr:Gfo/Idh/MocA family oxidoreductase [Chthonomonadaceae bacterium]